MACAIVTIVIQHHFLRLKNIYFRRQNALAYSVCDRTMVITSPWTVISIEKFHDQVVYVESNPVDSCQRCHCHWAEQVWSSYDGKCWAVATSQNYCLVIQHKIFYSLKNLGQVWKMILNFNVIHFQFISSKLDSRLDLDASNILCKTFVLKICYATETTFWSLTLWSSN